jgi:hypothetical protein
MIALLSADRKGSIVAASLAAGSEIVRFRHRSRARRFPDSRNR